MLLSIHAVTRRGYLNTQPDALTDVLSNGYPSDGTRTRLGVSATDFLVNVRGPIAWSARRRSVRIPPTHARVRQRQSVQGQPFPRGGHGKRRVQSIPQPTAAAFP